MLIFHRKNIVKMNRVRIFQLQSKQNFTIFLQLKNQFLRKLYKLFFFKQIRQNEKSLKTFPDFFGSLP